MCHDDPCEQNQGSGNDEHGDTAPPHKGDLQKNIKVTYKTNMEHHHIKVTYKNMRILNNS